MGDMMVIVMIVSIVYLEHRSFMVIYGHIMPYLKISLIISLKNHESPCNLVFFGVSTKSHTQKTTSEAKLCGCHVLAAEKPQSRCGFGWSGGWFP